MTLFGKFQHYKNENLDDYFTAVGVPFMGRKMMLISSPTMEISINKDVFSIKTSSIFRTVESKFRLEEEYEEKMPNQITINSVTTRPKNSELVTNSIIPETNSKCGRHYLFTDEECIITLTHENAKSPGKRYFKRIISNDTSSKVMK